MNPFLYRGYYYDNEAGFYYLNSRYYDPAKGRFLNADIYVNANGDLIGFNMFAYCSNNPVMGYDQSGYGKFWDTLKTWEAQIGEWADKTFKPVYDYVDYLGNLISKIPETAWNSVEYEFGVGAGLGGSVEYQGVTLEMGHIEDEFYAGKKAGEDAFIGKRVKHSINISGACCSFPSGTVEYYDFDGRLQHTEDYYPCFDFSIGYGVSVYGLVGASLSLSFNVEYFVDTLFGEKILGLD